MWDPGEVGGSEQGRPFSMKVRIRVELIGASDDAGSGRIKIPSQMAGMSLTSFRLETDSSLNYYPGFK